MPRVSRMIISGEQAVYHVMSRTALPGFPLGEVEKDFLLGLIKRMSRWLQVGESNPEGHFLPYPSNGVSGLFVIYVW